MHNGGNQEPIKIHINYYASADGLSQQGNIKILSQCLKEYGFKIYNLKLPSK
jgi:hypothetical protein